MWEAIKTFFGAITPISALREQVNLLKAQLAEAHSLIERQTAAITQLETQNQDLAQKAEQLKKIQSESFKLLNYNDRGIV
jgi:SMC interacting uncharacterized protein involved in chromosome segregation